MAVEHDIMSEVKEIEFEGYKLNVDTDRIDDVDTLDTIDRIENKNHVGAIVPLLKIVLGEKQYEDLKAHYVKKEGKFRATKLPKIYALIMENFDPKD